MERSAGEVQTAEVTVAVRDVQIDGLEVKEGQLIAETGFVQQHAHSRQDNGVKNQ